MQYGIDLHFHSWIIGTSTQGMKKMETNRPGLIGVRQVLIMFSLYLGGAVRKDVQSVRRMEGAG